MLPRRDIDGRVKEEQPEADDVVPEPENGPYNPPKEFVQVTRGKRGGIAYIINGKRVDG